MIYTLTTNPAIDMNIASDGLTPNAVTRTRDAVYTANGKGLNVSFTLAHWGTQSTILGFFGGFSGDYIVEEAGKICPVKPTYIDGITRVNVFLNTGENEYSLPNAGAPVCIEKQDEMIELLAVIDDMDMLIISGSLSPLMDDTFYKRVFEVLEPRGIPCILDISASCLHEMVAYKPYLIKPNDDEFEAIFNLPVKDQDPSVVAESLNAVRAMGAQRILLTLGDKGAYFASEEGVWRATCPKVKMLSSACAGDASLASFLSIYLDNHDNVESALVRAMATGANVVMCAGLGDFALVEELSEQVHVERIA